MARQAYRDVVDAVRAMVLDSEGLVFKDAVLLQFVDLAQRKVHMALTVAGAGSGQFLTASATDIPITAVTQTFVDWTSATPLPDDLIVPLKIWEKLTGLTDDNYTEIARIQRTENTIQDDRLSVWWWENSQIQLVGATTARTIRIEYLKLLPKVADLSTALPIPAEADAMVYYVAHLCALARGSLDQATAVKAEADLALSMLSNLNQKSAQEGASRRIPYSGIPTNSGGRFV